MLLEPPTPVTVDMMYIDALVEALDKDDARVALARRYFNGSQDVYMSERVKEFLDIHDEDARKFCLNICRTIVLAVKDELSVSGFNTSEEPDGEGVKTQAKWAWDLWTKNHMDSVQAEVHESALADRETFIIVDFDYNKKRSRFIHNYRYTNVDDTGGDGQGVWMVYENDDINQDPICAVKQWLQTDYDSAGQAVVTTRRTIYYPDHIEKWYSDGSWKHFIEKSTTLGADGNVVPEPWPIPWVKKDKTPMGIPVIHFRNVGLTPEHWDAVPIQDSINKTLVDILASNDLTAFQMLAALGWYPTTDGNVPKSDGSNLLRVGPGQFIGTKDPNGKLQVIIGSDPTPLVNTLKDLVLLAAQVTSTPTSRFTTTKLIASQETLKEQNTQLKKKATDRRVLYGDAWEACMDMARRIENTFGEEAELDEEITFSTIWVNNQTIEELLEKKKLGIPEETLWAEAGYSTEQISSMKKTLEYQATMAGWQTSINIMNNPPEPQPIDETKKTVPPTNGKKPPVVPPTTPKQKVTQPA